MTTKAEESRRLTALNAAESMGGGRSTAPTIPSGFASTIRPLSSRLQNVKRRNDVSDIPIEKIAVDESQPRKMFAPEKIEEMAQSLLKVGQLSPVSVRWNEAAQSYILISGERRFRGALQAGLPTLCCQIVPEADLTAARILGLQIIENLIREDLQPIEEAKAFRTLMDQHGYTQTRLSEEIGVPQGAIAKALATLSLPVDVQELVDAGKIVAATAYQLTRVEGEDAQREIAARVVAEELTIAETTEIVARSPKARPGRAGGAKAKGKAGAPRLPTERKHKPRRTALRVVVSGRKGFDVASWIMALEDALEDARTALEGQGRAGDAGAA